MISSIGVGVTDKVASMLMINASITDHDAKGPGYQKHRMGRHRVRVQQELNELTGTNSHVATNGAIMVCALTGIFALVQKSNLWRSPRILAGSIWTPPSNLLFFQTGVLFRNIPVLVSLMVGGTVPAVVGALFDTATFRSSLALFVSGKKSNGKGDKRSLARPFKIGLEAMKSSFLEGSFIFILFLLLPSSVGFH